MDAALALAAALAAAGPIQVPEPRAASLSVSLDAHRHFSEYYPEEDTWENPDPAMKSFARIAGDMRANAIEHSFMISDGFWAEPEDARSYNAELSSFVSAHRALFTGFCGADASRVEAPAIIKECLALPGMRGLKLHPNWLGHSVAHPAYGAALDAAEPFGAVILVHANFGRPEEAEALIAHAKKRPGLTFVVAHAAEGRLDRLIGAPENVLTEVSTFNGREPKAFVASLKAFGLHRVLFGVDGNGYAAKPTLAAFRALPLADEEKTAILETNGRALLARLRR